MSSPSVSVQWPQRQSHGSQETSSAAKAPVTSKPHNISPQKLHFCSEGVSKCGNMKQHVREFPSKLPQNKCSKRCQANLRCRHLSTQSMSDTRRSLSRRHSGEVATWVRKFVKDVSNFLSFPLKSRAQRPWGNLMFPDLPASNGEIGNYLSMRGVCWARLCFKQSHFTVIDCWVKVKDFPTKRLSHKL